MNTNAKAEKYIPWFIDYAHKNGAKIHGLGFTKTDKLPMYHFDSVDSTSWLAGGRFGFLHEFRAGKMVQHQVPKGKRLSTIEGRKNNFSEWVKFQMWADDHY